MDNKKIKLAVIVPTLNAGPLWPEWISALQNQTCHIDSVLVIDSGSTDQTRELARAGGFLVHEIPKSDFNHGHTRQLAISLLGDPEIVVFLTQDAVLAGSHAIAELIKVFDEQTVAAAYGRQLPRRGANPIEAHGRVFNYPASSRLKSLEQLDHYGFNLIFISNSFAAYRVAALQAVGGFPTDVILGEDTCACAKMAAAGHKIAYQANAEVYHSHGYSILEEARRYFDTGVLHAREHWLLEQFGEPGGQGLSFVKSELRYLATHAPGWIPLAIVRTVTKYLFYKLGRLEHYLPRELKIKLSMNRQYWQPNQ